MARPKPIKTDVSPIKIARALIPKPVTPKQVKSAYKFGAETAGAREEKPKKKKSGWTSY